MNGWGMVLEPRLWDLEDAPADGGMRFSGEIQLRFCMICNAIGIFLLYTLFHPIHKNVEDEIDNCGGSILHIKSGNTHSLINF